MKSHKRISKKLKIKEMILFLLRLLILTLIIFLITNISLKKKQNNLSLKSKNNKLIVLDNNYQMLFNNKKKNDFEVAKEVIRDFFKNNPESNSLFLNGKEHVIGSISQLNNLLDEVKISYNFENSVTYDFLKNQDKFKEKEVIIISNYNDLLNFGTQKHSLINHENIDNQYIKNLEIKRIEYNRYQAKLLVKSVSTKEQTKTITLYQKDKKISQSILTISPNESKEIVISFSISSEKKDKNINELEFKVELEDDDLNYDNYKYFLISTIKPKEVLIVNGGVSTISYQDESFYFKNALNSSENKYKFNLTQRNWITSRSIRNYDLIVFLNNTFDDYENQYVMREFLKKGKSVFISLGNNTNIENFNYFWKDIISLRNFKDLEKIKKYKFINFFNYDYSFFKNISFVKKELSSYPVLKYFNLATKQNIKEIATLNDGTLFIGEKLLKRGKLIIYTSTIDRDWNDFPLSTNYAPLIISLVKYLLETNEKNYDFYLSDISQLKDFKVNATNLKSGIYQYHSKIAYNSPLNRSEISHKNNKTEVRSLLGNNLLIPLKNWFIIILMFIIFLETLFFIKRFLWVRND
jgi:hypothetical protein